jgi:hypothetical protein
MESSMCGGFKKIDAAVDYAKQLRDDANVMFDAVESKYYVVRLNAVKHWENLRETVAEIRISIDVKLV